VAAEIVNDDDVAGLERGDEELLDVGQEAFAVDWSIDDTRSIDTVPAQRGKEGQCSPAAMRNLGDQALASQRAAVGSRHVGLGQVSSMKRSRR
jgi:hypothetical protein